MQYSLSVIKDKIKEVQRYEKLWLHAREELNEVLEKEHSLKEDFKKSVEQLINDLNRGTTNDLNRNGDKTFI